MNTKNTIMSMLCLGALMVSCSGNDNNEGGKNAAVPAIDMTSIDTTYRAQDNFYMYCNGGWMKANPLKPSDSRYGTFDLLRDSAKAQIHHIVDELLTKKVTKGTDEYRVAVLYRQAMDSTKRNELGAKPIQAELRKIESLTDKGQILEYAAKMDQEYGSSILFSSYVHSDNLNSDINILHINQVGLGLGNRDYYTQKSEENDKIIEGYLNYINRILILAGYPEDKAKSIADNAFKVENQLAQICYTKEMLRDDKLNYNMKNIAEFTKQNQGFDWVKYFEIRGLDVKEADFSQLDFFKKFAVWYNTIDVNLLKDYIIYGTVSSCGGMLSDDFAQASFDFFSKQLSGVKEMKPRWERCVSVVDGILGEALGKVYVDRYFSADAKKAALKLVENLQKALKERISGLAWMGDSTKTKAIDKLSNYKVKIGYPDKWKDYSGLDIDESKTYFENMLSATRFMQQDNLKDLGKPVDKTKWLMNPQTVNAYYMPSTNEICFPAAILQPPFFNINADDAVNYGAIGVVIGHEMTHGFDDQGSNFDKNGNMVNWWTKEDQEKFKAAADRLAKQYSKNEILPGLFANGNLTLGENIADQGGLLTAFLAMQIAQGNKKVEPIDGLTPEQRFYIGYARLWGQNITTEAIKRLTKMDVHSLGSLRVNQALKNLDSFYKAFNIQPTDSMYIAPEDRVLVW